MFINILKYILGIFLAIAILAGGGVAAALYFMNQVSLNPPKPIYDNDTPQVKAQVAKSQIKGNQPSPNSIAENKAQPLITPQPSVSTKPLPPGAYQAHVTWSSGLVLRSAPKQDAQRNGELSFNQKVIVLQQSDDQAWEKVRLEDSNEEGWIKAGNTEKIDKATTNNNQDQTTTKDTTNGNQDKATTPDNQDKTITKKRIIDNQDQTKTRNKQTLDNQDQTNNTIDNNQDSQPHRRIRRERQTLRKAKRTDNQPPTDQSN